MPLVKTTGHISQKSPRANEWQRVFGSHDIPLTSPIPCRCNFIDDKGVSTSQKFYFIDIDRLAPEQLEHVAAFVANKFNIPLDDVWDEIDQHGIPILADDVSVIFDARLL